MMDAPVGVEAQIAMIREQCDPAQRHISAMLLLSIIDMQMRNITLMKRKGFVDEKGEAREGNARELREIAADALRAVVDERLAAR